MWSLSLFVVFQDSKGPFFYKMTYDISKMDFKFRTAALLTLQLPGGKCQVFYLHLFLLSILCESTSTTLFWC